MESLELSRKIVEVLDKKKGLNIVLIKTESVTVVADYFVIVTGTSSTHVKSLADDVEEATKKFGVAPEHIEGRATGWILLDYGTVVVHVFDPKSRDYYNLEKLWSDGDNEDISDIVTED